MVTPTYTWRNQVPDTVNTFVAYRVVPSLPTSRHLLSDLSV